MSLTEKEEKILNDLFNVTYIDKKAFDVWSVINQAEKNIKDNKIPLVVFWRNHSKMYAIIEFDKLMKLLYKAGNINKLEDKKDLDEKL